MAPEPGEATYFARVLHAVNQNHVVVFLEELLELRELLDYKNQKNFLRSFRRCRQSERPPSANGPDALQHPEHAPGGSYRLHMSGHLT